MLQVTEYTKQLSQEEDSCGRPNEIHQYLDIETTNNGAGYYAVIKTERWAIDDREEWIKLWDNHIEPILKEVNS
jgi:hypothetical protein